MAIVLLATHNPGKVREIQALVDELPPVVQGVAPQQRGLIELVLPQQLGIQLEVQESGQTYHENAALKALAFCRASRLVTLADDSGLEVDALGGAPGLHSARYSPLPGASDADRRARLLRNLHSSPRPWLARFRCVVVLAAPGFEPPQLEFYEGECLGEIIPSARGENGFGYDPIFLLSELGKTMAELSTAEKNQLSHRARAVKAALPGLLRIIG
jgi:XTP/dITP diphosphohydrolase